SQKAVPPRMSLIGLKRSASMPISSRHAFRSAEMKPLVTGASPYIGELKPWQLDRGNPHNDVQLSKNALNRPGTTLSKFAHAKNKRARRSSKERRGRRKRNARANIARVRKVFLP